MSDAELEEILGEYRGHVATILNAVTTGGDKKRLAKLGETADNSIKQALLSWRDRAIRAELEKMKETGTVENGFMLPIEVLDDRIQELSHE